MFTLAARNRILTAVFQAYQELKHEKPLNVIVNVICGHHIKVSSQVVLRAELLLVYGDLTSL